MTGDKLLLAVALALTACIGAYAYLVAPTKITVAVGPAGSTDARLMESFRTLLKGHRSGGLRLKIVPVANPEEAADALDRQTADFAVIRPDLKTPADGLTAAILRDAAIIVAVPSSAKIEDVSDLAGRTVALANGGATEAAFLEGVLGQLDTGPDPITVRPFAPEDLTAALHDGRIAGVALVAPASGATAQDLVRSLVRSTEGGISILPVELPDGAIQRSPVLASATISAGTWGNRPRVPASEIKTVSVSYRLMARSGLDRGTVSQTVEALFQLRGRIASQVRSANLMRAPDLENSAAATSAVLPNHPGAVDYYERDTKSLFDRYGDYIYLVALLGSGILSGLAWLRQRLVAARREHFDDVLDRLLAVPADARKAESVTELDGLCEELDRLVADAVRTLRIGGGSGRSGMLSLALSNARSAIADRHGRLAALPRPDEASPPLRLATGA